MKVLMLPHLQHFQDAKEESGIRRVIEAYFRYLPQFGIELVDPEKSDYDLKVNHAACRGGIVDVTHCHGLYWTADYAAPSWEYKTNKRVIEAVRHAKEVTVPSAWVAETFQRDMRFSPHIIPHGIERQEWQHEEENQGYVLWNKNRSQDVCSPEDIRALANGAPEMLFLTTHAPDNIPQNVKAVGNQPHDMMKKMVQSCGVYLATTKETFGIGILEAMAAGKPVLGYRHGGIVDLVEHGINGYLAEPGAPGDLLQGLHWCLEHQKVLGENGRELVKKWTWEKACRQVAGIYQLALQPERATACIIIPTYNYGEHVESAIRSAQNQDYPLLENIVVVDDGSQDDTKEIVENLTRQDKRIKYIWQPNQGVAVARNTGIANTTSKYICCLDADDSIEPSFLSSCIALLENDRSVGIVYTGLEILYSNGNTDTAHGQEIDFNRQLLGTVNGKSNNQVPTCNVFRKEMWKRLGGYRQRYAPRGCGTEDAEFWLRAGSYGWGIKLATSQPLVNYRLGGYTTGDQNYEEVDWTAWHPFCEDGMHPFASIAKPNDHSHPVRQYDEPLVSVIIPVGPGHENDIINALDSLEAQTVRQWEAIVVWDTGEPIPKSIRKTYPYVRWVETEGHKGAGYSRNRGVEIARAPFLDFLDADDWFLPTMLEEKLQAYAQYEGEIGVYTDQAHYSLVDRNVLQDAVNEGRLLDYQETKNDQYYAWLKFTTPEYNWERAINQPRPGREYQWCLISTLIPTYWHDEIGGFDEEMEAWEDWDYFIRLARAGKAFVRVPEVLLIYHQFSGKRREFGRQNYENLVQYMLEKYEGSEVVMCKGCGRKKSRPASRSNAGIVNPAMGVNPAIGMNQPASKFTDDQFVFAEFQGIPPGNRGQRPVVGAMIFPNQIGGSVPMIRRTGPGGRSGYSFNYRQLAAGDKTLVHREDLKLTPQWWSELQTGVVEEVSVPTTVPRNELPEAPVSIATKVEAQPVVPPIIQTLIDGSDLPLSRPEDLSALSADNVSNGKSIESLSLSDTVLQGLSDNGIQTTEELVNFGIAGLTSIKGVGPKRAQRILELVG